MINLVLLAVSLFYFNCAISQNRILGAEKLNREFPGNTNPTCLNEKITLRIEMKTVPLIELFNEIERQVNVPIAVPGHEFDCFVYFTYLPNQIDPVKVTLEMSASIEEILQSALSPNGLTFKIMGSQIVILSKT